MKKESKALLEVRNWKKEVAKDAKVLRGQALIDYYNGVLRSIKQRKRKAA